MVLVLPGEDFICKDKESGFIKPSINMNLLDDDLARGQLSSQNLYDTWVKMFAKAFKRVKNADITTLNAKIKVSPHGL